ncbi:MAG: hypothetical protein MRY74_02705 [Neomegalonema sp.]|nr:hypothetical protein [Neomegalonema sp.]
MNLKQGRQALTWAFEILRSEGWAAEENWQCCMTCGLTALPDDVEDYVFYHSQDEAGIEASGGVYLAYGGDALRLCEALRDEGLEVKWSGSRQERMWVVLRSESSGAA